MWPFKDNSHNKELSTSPEANRAMSVPPDVVRRVGSVPMWYVGELMPNRAVEVGTLPLPEGADLSELIVEPKTVIASGEKPDTALQAGPWANRVDQK